MYYNVLKEETAVMCQWWSWWGEAAGGVVLGNRRALSLGGSLEGRWCVYGSRLARAPRVPACGRLLATCASGELKLLGGLRPVACGLVSCC